MLPWRVRKYNSGFTLVEMLTVVIIIGVLAAITAPNLLGLYNRNRVNRAMREVEGALKEAQKQAIRIGRQCTIDINTNDISNSANGCLLSNRVLNKPGSGNPVILNSNQGTITFSGKGNLGTPGPKPVFVTYLANASSKQSCVVIESTLGSLRTGDYTGDPSTLTAGDDSSASCQ